MKLIHVVAASLLLFASACSSSEALTRGSERGSASGAELGAADVAEIVCEEDGSTELLTPEVAVRADGVHLRVHNLTGESASINGLALDVDEGTSRAVATFAPPGEVAIACWPFSRHEGPEPERLPLALADPNGYWASPELECGPDGVIGSIIYDYGTGAEGEHGDPVELARRRLTGLTPSDTLERVGYPESASPIVAVVRDGKSVATVTFTAAENGGWLLVGGEACGATGIYSK